MEHGAECRRETEDRGQMAEYRFFEVGRRTRRRPIGRDYAAAKDAEVGKERKSEGGMRKWEKKGSWKAEGGSGN
jgi:hypothetical protein